MDQSNRRKRMCALLQNVCALDVHFFQDSWMLNYGQPFHILLAYYVIIIQERNYTIHLLISASVTSVSSNDYLWLYNNSACSVLGDTLVSCLWLWGHTSLSCQAVYCPPDTNTVAMYTVHRALHVLSSFISIRMTCTTSCCYTTSSSYVLNMFDWLYTQKHPVHIYWSHACNIAP